jgi:hypothetical protein
MGVSSMRRHITFRLVFGLGAALCVLLVTQPVGAQAAQRQGLAAATRAQAGTARDEQAAAGEAATTSANRATLSPVQVGFVVTPDVSSFAAALGLSAQNPGNAQSEINAVVNWVNTNGGLGGHPIVPVIANVQLTQSSDFNQESQSVCDDLTQDHHVAAAVFVGNAPQLLISCLNAAHVLFVTNGDTIFDATDDAQNPYLMAPGQADGGTLAKALLDQAFSQRLLKSGDTLGLVVEGYGAPERAASHVVDPLLKAHKVTVVQFSITSPTSAQAIATSVSQIEAAQLKMAASNVQNVMFLCTGCMPFFVTASQSQHYFPRYLFTTFDQPNNFVGSKYAQAMSSAHGIGVDPVTDVGTYTDPSVMKFNSTYALCNSIEMPTDQVTNNTAEYASQAFCDGTLWLRDAAKAEGGSDISGKTLLEGMNALGSKDLSSLSFSNDITSANHNGASSFRSMAWNNACSCLTYTSGHPAKL